jgi:type III secretory pathway lipoprotein EscJ
VKTLESKETRASKKATVTHNSVFAAHRLQCRMTIRKIDIRHFVLESIEATALYRPVTAATTKRSDYSFRGSHQWRDVICGVCSAKYFSARHPLFTKAIRYSQHVR